MTPPLSARATARLLGISVDSLLRRYRAGRFPAVIDDGKLLRFDADSVRLALSRPVKQSRKKQTRMIPTC